MAANVENKNENYDKLLESVAKANPDILILQEVTENWRDRIEILQNDYLHHKIVPRAGGSGLAIFSRYPIEKSEILKLDESTHPALFCEINLDGTLLSLLTIHPPTPIRTDKFINRNRQFAESALILKNAPEPKILIGDLNTTMWSPYFSDLVNHSGLRDVRIGRGIYPSWISFFPAPLRIPIDHCLVSESVEIEGVELGNFTGSDHFPLVVNLKF